MCEILGVSTSGFYAYQKRKPSRLSEETSKITEEIRKVYAASLGIYGSPKVANELQTQGHRVSRPRVARIMRAIGLRSIVKKKYKGCTTDSNHTLPISPNLLERDFDSAAPGEKWVSDITYIPTTKGWTYLTAIIDLYGRRVVGWSLSRTMTATDTTVAAWNKAVRNETIKDGMIFHSDRGIQYAATVFTQELKSHKVKLSMSRKGNCWDNAVAESFFKTLKSELINHKKFIDINQLRVALFHFIEIWYNRKRIHQSLGYKTPVQYNENFYLNQA